MSELVLPSQKRAAKETVVTWTEFSVGVGRLENGQFVLVFETLDHSERHTFALNEETRKTIVESLSLGIVLS